MIKNILLSTILNIVVSGIIYPQEIVEYARDGYLDGVKQALKQADKWTKEDALETAISNSHEEIVQLLVNSGVELEGRYLFIPAQTGDVDMVKMLISNKIPVNDINYSVGEPTTPIGCATTNGHLEVVDTLLKAGADAGCALRTALETDQTNIAKLILTYDVNVNGKYLGMELGNKPLIIASSKGYTDIVKLLLQKKAYINFQYEGNTALDYALMEGHYEIAKVLINAGAEIVNNGTPIRLSSRDNNLEIVKLLVEKGANINFVNDYDGWTPILYTAYNNNLDVFNYLIEKGANIHAITKSNLSAIDLAFEQGYTEMVKILATKGVKYNSTNSFFYITQ